MAVVRDMALPRGVECLNILRLEKEKMSVQFLLFVIAVLLLSIFWVLSKINSHVKTLLVRQEQDRERAKQDSAERQEAKLQKP